MKLIRRNDEKAKYVSCSVLGKSIIRQRLKITLIKAGMVDLTSMNQKDLDHLHRLLDDFILAAVTFFVDRNKFRRNYPDVDIVTVNASIGRILPGYNATIDRHTYNPDYAHRAKYDEAHEEAIEIINNCCRIVREELSSITNIPGSPPIMDQYSVIDVIDYQDSAADIMLLGFLGDVRIIEWEETNVNFAIDRTGYF